MIKKKKTIINKQKTKQKTNKNKTIPVEFQLTEKQVERLLLYNTIINHFLLLLNNNTPKHVIKKTMIDLFKKLRKHNEFISKKTTNDDLDIIYMKLYSQMKKTKHQINSNKTMNHGNMNHTYHGGFYFKSLEEKGDQPLTGADLTTLLDEMQQFFYNAQYTEEGKFLQDTNALISMLRGDLAQFKGLLQYRIFPKYYQITPPFIKWDNIKKDIFEEKKYEDLPDYLIAYQSYLRSRDEYLVAKGLKSPSVLHKDLYEGFYNKLALSLDQNITQFQQYRNKLTGKISPIALPV